MDQQMDWAAFHRLDNATVVDFLTSVAGALCEQGILSSKDGDNLRLVLSGITSAPRARERPVLVELERQDADIIAVLGARFGQSGLCLNLLRHTLRAPVEELAQTLAVWGQQLVKKSELLFNRTFYVYDGAECEKATLYSTVIVDFSERLADSCTELRDCAAALAQMNPASLAGANEQDQALDNEIARALGFTGLVAQALVGQSESTWKRRLSQSLLGVAHASQALAQQLSANTASQTAYGVAAACDSLTAECQKLAQLELPHSASLMIWEMRRRSIIAALASINANLKALAEAALECMGQEVIAPPIAKTAAVKRRLATDLIASGTPAHAAREATEALVRYVTEQKLQAKQVLVGELPRVHPALRPATLEMLAALEADAKLMSLATSEKTQTAGRAKRLAETFGKAATLTVLLCLAASFTFAGCGLKTKPISDVPELRPDIPFRAASTPPAANATNPQAAKPQPPLEHAQGGTTDRGTSQ